MYIDAISDIGTTRKENQDNFWCATLNIDNELTGLVCVCDGMGGLENGELASRMITETIRESILDGIQEKNINDVLKQVNTSLCDLSASNGLMGSTCTILICSNGLSRIFHVGDSRCYKICRNGDVSLLTRDHSVVKEYGIPESDKELYNKYKSKLTNCMGVNSNVRVDYYTGTYEEGDSFIVCSDGFWHTFDSHMGEMNLTNLSSCVNLCMQLGETDNITVGVLVS